MDLVVRLFAALRDRAGRPDLDLSGLPDELSVAGLKEEVARRHPELGDLGAVRAVIGTRYAEEGEAVRAGDEVALLPPVSGGSGDSEEALEAGVFELVSDPIDPALCAARVAHAACGANLLFTGSTRETNRGRDVVRLDYDAFAEMSGPEMGRIFAECRERFGRPPGSTDDSRLLRMLCQHRVGVVEVGAPSVAIAVASAHRDRAYAASRFLIDTLKERLPVWKKEVYRDGEHWIGDRS